jgi:hypothetical protein
VKPPIVVEPLVFSSCFAFAYQPVRERRNFTTG